MRGEPAGGRLLIALTEPAALARWKACVATLQSAGHLVQTRESLKEAAEDLAAATCEVAVLAMPVGRHTDRKVSELLTWAPELTPLVLAGVPPGPAARALIVSGAFITVADPFDQEDLERAVGGAVKYCRALRREARFDPAETLPRLLGSGPGIGEVDKLVSRAAASRSPVVVIGEAGSGKHIVAQAVHAHPRGPRRLGPFVKCLLSGIDPGRIEEELYGTDSRPGPFERAHGGTLFIDDITLLPRAEQGRLLELLALGARATITRADQSATVPADLRLVGGSSIALEDLPSHGRLQDDLYYRIMVFPIRLPPLRQRVEDIPGLASALLDRYAARLGKTIVGMTPRAAAILRRYAWPGNIRELEEHIERAARRARGPVLDAEDLAELAHMTAGRAEGAPTGTLDLFLSLDESLPLAEAGRRAATAAEVASIRRALKVTEGNVTRAAKLLGVSRIHLQKRMKKYGLRESR